MVQKLAPVRSVARVSRPAFFGEWGSDKCDAQTAMAVLLRPGPFSRPRGGLRRS
jgi:hypothetical protein